MVDTNKRYLTKTVSLKETANDTKDQEPTIACPEGFTYTHTHNYTQSTTQSYDGVTCTLGTEVCFGAGSYSETYSGGPGCGPADVTFSFTCANHGPSGATFFHMPPLDFGGCVTSSSPGVSTVVSPPADTTRTTTETLIFGCSGGDYSTSISRTRITVETLSSEYTTDQLETNTDSALPAFDGDWNDTAGSMRSLAASELNYSIRKSKWRLVHAPTGSCYLKVWLRTKFVPEGGGSPVYSALEPYVWEGSGNPCYANPALPYDHVDNLITSGEFTLDIPSENGTVTVEIEKFSCVRDYEPDLEAGDSNGYPTP